MKEKSGSTAEKLNRLLIMAICVIGGIILLMTLIGFITKKAVPGKNLWKPEPLPETTDLNSKILPFAGLGRIRAATKPLEGSSTGTPVIITPWFNYPAEDKTFYEELSQKSPLIKQIITSYFSRNTIDYFTKTSEKIIKEQLLKLINEKLVLGKIDALFFSEYIFLD